MVYPFKSEGERRSFSMNIEVVQHDLDDNGNLAGESESNNYGSSEIDDFF